MKIVFLSPIGQLGGAERSLIDLFAGLREARPDWSLELIAAANGPLLSWAESLDIPSHLLEFPPALARLGDWSQGASAAVALMVRLLSVAWATAAYLLRLRRLLRVLSPDIIHSNGLKTHILAAWAKPRRVPLVWHLHDYVRPRPVMSRLLRLHFRLRPIVLANSRSVAADFEALCGNGSARCVYNSVDLERCSPDGPACDLDALSGLAPAPPGTVRIGLVATFARWKGHEMFLRSLARLPTKLPVRGYIIGGALYDTGDSQHRLEDLRGLAGSLGLAGKVGFTGFIERVEQAFRALDIVVHASTLPEPFGRVILEAMACGRPVIVSRQGGAAEIITPSVDALGYPPGDEGALAESIRSLVVNSDLRKKLGRAARLTAQRRFGLRRWAGDLASIYESLTPGKG